MYSLNHHHTGKISLVPFVINVLNPTQAIENIYFHSSVAPQERSYKQNYAVFSLSFVRLLLVEIILLRFVLLHVSKVHTF